MLSDVKLSFGPFQVQRRQRWKPQSVFYHFSDCLLCQKVVSFPFKWSPERSRSTSSFTCRSLCKFTHCSSMQKEQKRWAAKKKKRLFEGPEWSWQQKNALGFTVSGLCGSAQPNEFQRSHMAALWATRRQQHLLSQPVFTPSIFRVNGPSQGRSLTCNSPLM